MEVFLILNIYTRFVYHNDDQTVAENGSRLERLVRVGMDFRLRGFVGESIRKCSYYRDRDNLELCSFY